MNSNETKTDQAAPSTDQSPVDGLLTAGLKYSVLVGFALYGIGFVIWYAFLGQNGLYPRSIQQIEYFGAALCYVSFVAVLGAPMAFLLRISSNKDSSKEAKRGQIAALFAAWF